MVQIYRGLECCGVVDFIFPSTCVPDLLVSCIVLRLHTVLLLLSS